LLLAKSIVFSLACKEGMKGVETDAVERETCLGERQAAGARRSPRNAVGFLILNENWAFTRRSPRKGGSQTYHNDGEWPSLAPERGSQRSPPDWAPWILPPLSGLLRLAGWFERNSILPPPARFRFSPTGRGF